jgi:hypothetical protein
LSYTNFSYANLNATGNVTAGEPITLSFDVRNTGQLTGDEVIQVYVHSPLRGEPIKSLQYFERLTLSPSDLPNRKVISLPPGAFTFFNETTGKLEQGTGNFTISVGGTSASSGLQSVTIDITPTSSSSKELSVTVIVAIIIASIVLVITIIAGIYFCRKRNKNALLEPGKSAPLLRD